MGNDEPEPIDVDTYLSINDDEVNELVTLLTDEYDIEITREEARRSMSRRLTPEEIAEIEEWA